MTMSKLHRLWATRYGHEPVGTSIPEAEARFDAETLAVYEKLLSHRSVRQFLPDALPAGTLELLIAAAQSAPSSSNLQAWSVVVIQDAGRRERMATWANQQAHVRQAPLFLAWLADLSRLDRTAARRGQAADGNRYVEQLLVATIDAALAAQNVVVAAEAQGLGTVYIGALRNHPDRVARELALPPHVFPLFGLCIGRPDPAHPAEVKPRLAQQVVVHHEHYDTAAEAAGVQAYDETLQAFQRSQNLAPVPWSEQASKRVRGPESLSGRDRLTAHLHEQGFELL